MPKKQEKNSTDQDRIRQLERALEGANLKIIGLETMINIAEQDLKIDIRKKSGTKQYISTENSFIIPIVVFNIAVQSTSDCCAKME